MRRTRSREPSGDDTVREVGGRSLGIGGADAGRAPHEVDEPRHGGEGDEGAQPSRRDHAGDEGHRDVGDEGDDALSVGREQIGEPPHAETAEEDRPDDGDGEAESHVEQPQDAAAASTARPVGFGDVDPSSRPFHPLTKSPHNCRGLSGNGRNSPIVGTERLMNERLAMRTAMITANQVMSGASERSRQRRMTAWLRPAIGASPLVDADHQLRVAGSAERRQPIAAVRLEIVHLGVADPPQLGDRTAPGEESRETRDGPEQSARTEAHASRAWPLNTPTTVSTMVSTTSSTRRTGRREPGGERQRRSQVVARPECRRG